jgi:hypothetical protein
MILAADVVERLKLPYVLRPLMFASFPDTLRADDFCSGLANPFVLKLVRSRAALQPTRRAREWHRDPTRRGRNTSAGISVERRAMMPRPRSRYRVPRLGHDDTGDGHPRSGHRSQRGLGRVFTAYGAYYSRTHLSLNKDSPIPRQVASPADGDIVAIPQVSGLHHRYERHAA